MSATRDLTLSIPVELLDELARLAQEEGCSLHDLALKAVRIHSDLEKLDRWVAQNKGRSIELGYTEEDVMRFVKEIRAERRDQVGACE